MDPVQAYRCASVNGAIRLGRTDLGLIGAGRRADMLVVSDLEAVEIEAVYTDGILRARDRKPLEPVTTPPCTPPVDTVKVSPLSADDFVLRIPGLDEGTATLRVIAGQLFTMWSEVTVDVTDGIVHLPEGHLVQAAIHRYGRAPAVPQLGVLSGWGTWTGAMATTVAHDTHNLVVFGRDPVDMAVAANAVIAAGGGIAVASAGSLDAIVELPIAGLLSPLPPEEVADQQRALEVAASRIGVVMDLHPHPVFAVMASSLACLPGPHLTDVGLVDGTTGERVGALVLATA
jgi:adenine deaminase